MQSSKPSKPQKSHQQFLDLISYGRISSTYKRCLCLTWQVSGRELEPPADVRAAFVHYARNANHMTPHQLQQFLVHEQGEARTSLEDAERIARNTLHENHKRSKTFDNNLTLDDFFHFLFSFELNPPIPTKVHQDMRKPLSHYFMFTGHNSYLTGNQITSPSSDVPIIEALKKGVRVIELDIWPNSANDDVRVLHGNTPTKPIDLVTCLKSIATHAFVASPYPVIITFEDHLKTGLQSKVAQMCKKWLGNLLYIPECDCERLREFGSPENLQFKILISTKPPKEYLEVMEQESRRERDADEQNWGLEPVFSPPRSYQPPVIDGEDDLGAFPAREYKSLIAFQSKRPKGDVVEELRVDPNSVRRMSWSESTIQNAARTHGAKIVRFTQKNILRVYPKATRFTSANYDPSISWMHGAHMVAFNMQGSGRPLWLMQGMFRANGGLGYVKKPDMLMAPGYRYHDNLPVKKTLKVKVYLGDGWQIFHQNQLRQRSPPNFYTKVGIYGVPVDCQMEKTTKKAHAWKPVWEEEFSFKLTVPELALLRIEVHDYNMFGSNDFAGQTCLPVSDLRSGFHAVPLYDKLGNKYENLGLMMHFKFV